MRFIGIFRKGKLWNGEGYNSKNECIYKLKDGLGFVKEIDEYGYLKYEGEYLNGERNGSGKEYFKEVLVFEGKYLNGKKWDGKGYNKNQKLIYELKDGNGFIKEYDVFNELKFEGEYSNGEINGKGKEYDIFSRLKFEGEYINGEKNGKGKEYDNNELIFEGEYFSNFKNNGREYMKIQKKPIKININNIKGIKKRKVVDFEEDNELNQTNYNIKLDNEISDYLFGIINEKGYIKEFYDNGKLKFEGEYLNGERNGIGKEYKNDKLKYEGEYLNGKRNGSK